jgi:hypothetical protein
MKPRSIAGVLGVLSVLGGCTAAVKPPSKKLSLVVAPAKPPAITIVQPARYTLVDSVGASLDEATEFSPHQVRTPVIVNGERLFIDNGLLAETTHFPESLSGFRSLPPRLGGGYVVWSDEHTYHTPTFLGKLTPIAKIGARGGVRTWFDSFVLRTNIGALEVNPTSFTVRRTELARFAEMISLDGQVGVRTDCVGRMEASVDGGKTFRTLDPTELGNYVGPTVGPENKLVFRREPGEMRPGTMLQEMRILGPSGTLIPFEPKTNETLSLLTPSVSSNQEEPAPTSPLAPVELRLAAVAGALVPGERVLFVQEMNVRVLSAKTGQFIHNIPLNLSVPEMGNCQPITIGDDIFLACTHATGAHLLSLRGTPTTPQLEATFPEPGEFVAGLGQRFLFAGRCGSTPPTVRDFRDYAPAQSDQPTREAEPSAGSVDLPSPSEDPDKQPVQEISVCLRLADGTWIERHIEGLSDRTNVRFLPGDDGVVTVVYFDKQEANAAPPKPSEGVRVIRVDSKATKFGVENLYTPVEAADRQLQLVARNLWLDQKDGSVHGWTLAPPKAKTNIDKDAEKDAEKDEPETGEEEASEDNESEEADVDRYKQSKFVGVQINPDGTIVKHPLPEEADLVVVGGPYALARADHYQGQNYFESTDGGRTYTPVAGPPAHNLPEGIGGEIEGCSSIGCALRGGLVRLGWTSDTKTPGPTEKNPSKSEDDLKGFRSGETSAVQTTKAAGLSTKHERARIGIRDKLSSARRNADAAEPRTRRGRGSQMVDRSNDSFRTKASVQRFFRRPEDRHDSRRCSAHSSFDLKQSSRTLFEVQRISFRFVAGRKTQAHRPALGCTRRFRSGNRWRFVCLVRSSCWRSAARERFDRQATAADRADPRRLFFEFEPRPSSWRR